MTSPKQQRRARRRAEKLMERAVEAVTTEEFELAGKLSRRAIELGAVNPRLWLDHGRILAHVGDTAEAAEALRQAIALAPTFAEAFAALARLQANCGKLLQAERLQRRAVELAPGDLLAHQCLEGYRALLANRCVETAASTQQPERSERSERPERPERPERSERYDWEALAGELRARGMARVPGLLAAGECADLIAMWDHADHFEHEVSRDDPSGLVSYRFFTRPLPELVATLRAEIYARLAPIANDWNALVNRRERYPLQLAEFQARCHDAGQTHTTPILLRYPPRGFYGAHHDVAGRIVFPFQLAITLGPGRTTTGGDGGGDGGGELCLIDERPGKRLRERRLATAVGDGAVFCTRERPVQIAGVVGLQPVLHAVAEIGERQRFALGLPFHEHG